MRAARSGGGDVGAGGLEEDRLIGRAFDFDAIPAPGVQRDQMREVDTVAQAMGKRDGDLARRGGDSGRSVNRGRAGSQEARQQIHQCGFAGARRAHQRHRFTRVDVQIDVLQGTLSFGAEAQACGHAHLRRAAGFMLFTELEPSVLCPISMTYAVTPALQSNAAVYADWGPGLTRPAYEPGLKPWHAKAGLTMGMGMTEKQGGSDVRANTTHAEPDGSEPTDILTAFTVTTDPDNPQLAAIPVIALEPGTLIPNFSITTADPIVRSAGIPGRKPLNGPSYYGDIVREAFLFDTDPPQVLQLTKFARSDTSARLTADNRRVVFFASADPAGSNSDHNCEFFSIDRNGADVRQLTHHTGLYHRGIG